MYYKMKITALNGEGKPKVENFLVQANSPTEAIANVQDAANGFVASVQGPDGFDIRNTTECVGVDQVIDNDEQPEAFFWKAALEFEDMDSGKTHLKTCFVQADDFEQAAKMVRADYHSSVKLVSLSKTRIKMLVKQKADEAN